MNYGEMLIDVFDDLIPNDTEFYTIFKYHKVRLRDLNLGIRGVYRISGRFQEQIAHFDLCKRLMNDQASVMYSSILSDMFKDGPYVIKEFITLIEGHAVCWTDEEGRPLASIPLHYFGRRICCGLIGCSEHRKQLHTRNVQRNLYTKCLQIYVFESRIHCNLINFSHSETVHLP